MLLKNEMALAVAWFRRGMMNIRSSPERGEIVQTVVIIALFVAAAIVIGGILIAKATKTANNVKTQ